MVETIIDAYTWADGQIRSFARCRCLIVYFSPIFCSQTPEQYRLPPALSLASSDPMCRQGRLSCTAQPAPLSPCSDLSPGPLCWSSVVQSAPAVPVGPQLPAGPAPFVFQPGVVLIKVKPGVTLTAPPSGCVSSSAPSLARSLQAAGAATRIWLERLPGYAPGLNPDEGIWHYLKHVELKNVCCHDLCQLERELTAAVERLSAKPEIITSCFAALGDYKNSI